MSEKNFFDNNEDLKISKLFLEKIKKDQDKGERLESPKFIGELKNLLKHTKQSVNYEIEAEPQAASLELFSNSSKFSKS